MRLLKVFIGLIVILLLVLILLKNSDIVTVNLVFKTYEQVHLAVVIIITLSIGILVGFAIALTSVLESKTEARSIRSENRKLLEEVNNLRNIAIDEGIYELSEGED